MREAYGNLWDYIKPNAVIGITTNGIVNKVTGRNIMGKGCAQEARDRFKDIDRRIGTRIQAFGNRCFRVPMQEYSGYKWDIVTVPTKNDWRHKYSDPTLIVQSCKQLAEMADKFSWAEIILPRMGTGNGNLAWEGVKALIRPLLDDRFLVVCPRPQRQIPVVIDDKLVGWLPVPEE